MPLHAKALCQHNKPLHVNARPWAQVQLHTWRKRPAVPVAQFVLLHHTNYPAVVLQATASAVQKSNHMLAAWQTDAIHSCCICTVVQSVLVTCCTKGEAPAVRQVDLLLLWLLALAVAGSTRCNSTSTTCYIVVASMRLALATTMYKARRRKQSGAFHHAKALL